LQQAAQFHGVDQMNDVTEEKPHPCYWCGGETYLGADYVRCPSCGAEGPIGKQENGVAIQKWNSLASRLKPQPKKVTVKRWVNVYHCDGVPLDHKTSSESYYPGGFYLSEKSAKEGIDLPEAYIDTVEVEITFTDRRGCFE
jgi:hypothetical protein